MSSFQGLDYIYPATVTTVPIDGDPFVLPENPEGRWLVNVSLEPRRADRVGAALAVHRASHGTAVEFDLPMPQLDTATIADSASFKTGAASKGATTVQLKAGAATTINAGRFINLGGQKVYQVKSDVTVGAALTSVDIFPALVSDLAADSVWSPNPDLRCRYTEDSSGFWKPEADSVLRPSITVEEVYS